MEIAVFLLVFATVPNRFLFGIVATFIIFFNLHFPSVALLMILK